MDKSVTLKVSFSNGAVDTKATLQDWSNQLATFKASHEQTREAIAEAVTKVWDAYPAAKNMNLDAVASYALQYVAGHDPSAHAELSSQIKDYVRSSELYFIGKGKGLSGVVNLSRLSSEELEKINGQKAKRAA